jgi:polar amino acid transport system substrate-binding protein
MDPKKLVQCFVIVLFFASTITIQAREIMVLNTFSQNPPLLPFIQILMTEIFSRVDMDVKVRVMPAERSLKDANSDNGADGEALRTISILKNYSNLIKVPESIFSLKFVAFTIDKNFTTNSWASLKPYHIAHVSGMKAIEKSLSIVEPKSVQSVENGRLLFTLLAKGRTDIVVWGLIEGLINAEKLGEENEVMQRSMKNLRVLTPNLQNLPKYLFLNKRHIEIVSKVNSAIKEIKRSGVYQKIYDQTLGSVLNKRYFQVDP